VGLRIAETAALSDVGRQRGSNEDRFLEHSPVFAVADGMGGARAGEIASGIAVEAMAAVGDTDGTDEARLSTVARSANRRIYELAQADEARAGMGTTLTAVIVGSEEIAIGHVGDSRLYRLRDGALERLTKDHSLVEEMVRAGKLAPEDAENHPQKSIITRALGPEPDVEVETFTAPAQDGDVLLICSDGLTGMVSEAEIAAALERAPSLSDAARDLIETANRHGGRDNITVVLFRLGTASAGDGEEPDTLSGRDAEPGLDATAVHAAVAEAEGSEGRGGRDPAAEGGHSGVAGPGGPGADHPEGSDGSAAALPVGTATAAPPGQETLTLSADEAERLRREERRRLVRAPGAEGGGRPEEDPARAGAGRARRPSRGRRVLTAFAALVVVVAVAVGAWVAVRSVYFLGASPQGLVTLYRGLPYELPLGIRLYDEEFESTVPVVGLPAPRRQRILDHQLRDREDAIDLMRSLESARAAR
jgi:protein phosphatase